MYKTNLQNCTKDTWKMIGDGKKRDQGDRYINR